MPGVKDAKKKNLFPFPPALWYNVGKNERRLQIGFNNGYDSGYSDCEAENRKRWEREAVERYKAENPDGGLSSESSEQAKLPVKLLKGALFQLVNTASEAVLDQNDFPLSVVNSGSFSNPTDNFDALILCCIPAGQSTIASTPNGSDGNPGDFYLRPGLYVRSYEISPLVEWANLSFD